MGESAQAVPTLTNVLTPVLSDPAVSAQSLGHKAGARWWWAGPLDVEGLALGSVDTVAAALQFYAAGAGSPIEVGFTSAGVAASFASWMHVRVDGRPIEGFAPLSGFRRAADGWVRLHANYPHHADALLAALDVTSPSGVDAAIRDRSAADVESVVTERGGVAACVRTPEEWESSPPAAALREEPWIRFDLREESASSSQPRASGVRAALPLAGVRILDLTRVIAGPAATRLLGALGADVLRIDPPRIPELWDVHMDTGFDKRSAIADLTVAAELERVRKLLDDADAVLLGYRGAALQRIGLDVVSLREDRPDLPVVAFDAWGDRGPWAGRRGFDSIVQAATGIATVYGTGVGDNWRPGALPVQALDHAVGMGAAAAIVALLTSRGRGVTGSAHLSLARTAQQLLALPQPPAHHDEASVDQDLEVPLRNARGAHGDMVFVPPPLLINAQQLEYRHLPRRLGSSRLTWLVR